MKKTTVFALVLAIAVSACAPTGTAIPVATQLPPTATPLPTATRLPTAIPTNTPDIKTLTNELDAMFQKFVEMSIFSGSVLVAQNGQVILSEGYGFADVENNTPNTAQTRFRIYSITKQFTAMAILMLQEQGKLNVQDGICQYLVECPEAWKPITIHQLLTHTSGIPDLWPAYRTQEITSTVPLEQLIADAATRPLDFQPGAKFSYDNTGYILLGRIVETASGQSYGDFLQKNIFGPLRMLNTGYDPNRDDLALGYRNHGVSAADPVNMWTAFSAGGLYSTVEDLYLWDQALYTRTLLPQAALDTMFMAHVPAPDIAAGWSYGYGWLIGPDSQRRLLMHAGGENGYCSIISRYPDDDVTIIILANWEEIAQGTIADAIAEKLFGEE